MNNNKSTPISSATCPNFMDLVSFIFPPLGVSVLPFDLFIALDLLSAVIAVPVASTNLTPAVLLLLVAKLLAEALAQMSLAPAVAEAVAVAVFIWSVLGDSIGCSCANINWRCDSESANSMLVLNRTRN
jgi:hypothetical protein